jgi:hypothetical protein
MILHRVHLKVDIPTQSVSRSDITQTIRRSFIPVLSAMQHFLKATSHNPIHS